MSLQLFVRVLETGSFTRAGQDTNLSQPTVTKHIAELEESLQVRLLNRSTRKVTPTEIGLLYYEKCRNALHELDDAAALVRGDKSKVGGQLRIGASIAFGRRVLTPLLLEFMTQHPDLRVELICDDRYVDLVSQGIDAAVRMGALPDSSYGARHLGSSPWVMVASIKYLEKHAVPIDPKDLTRHDCLVYSTAQGNDIWRMTGEGDKVFNVAVQGRLRSNNLASLLAGVKAGFGIAMLPRYVAEDALQDGSVDEVLSGYHLTPQEINLVYPSPRLLPHKVSALSGFLQTKFHGDWWRGLQTEAELEPA